MEKENSAYKTLDKIIIEPSAFYRISVKHSVNTHTRCYILMYWIEKSKVSKDGTVYWQNYSVYKYEWLAKMALRKIISEEKKRLRYINMERIICVVSLEDEVNSSLFSNLKAFISNLFKGVKHVK